MVERDTIEIYVCGNNAWRQLDIKKESRISWPHPTGNQPFENGFQTLDIGDEPEDFHQFQKTLSLTDEIILGIWAGLSWTIIQTNTNFYFAGQLDDGFPTLDLALMARAGNGKLQTAKDFISLVTQANQHCQDDLKLQQLVANQTSWTALCHGNVWSWGDARFPGNLGRDVDDENPSSAPTILIALLPSNIDSTVTKIASGGYITAAVTSNHDIYVWGSPDPASSHSIIPHLSSTCESLLPLLDHPLTYDGRYKNFKSGYVVSFQSAGLFRIMLTSYAPDDPTPLIIQDPKNPGEEFDFLDIGIGLRHVIVLTTDHRVFVIGGNANSQYGLGNKREERKEFAAEWKEIDMASIWCYGTSRNAASGHGSVVSGVAAGGHASFIVLQISGLG